MPGTTFPLYHSISLLSAFSHSTWSRLNVLCFKHIAHLPAHLIPVNLPRSSSCILMNLYQVLIYREVFSQVSLVPFSLGFICFTVFCVCVDSPVISVFLWLGLNLLFSTINKSLKATNWRDYPSVVLFWHLTPWVCSLTSFKSNYQKNKYILYSLTFTCFYILSWD